MMSRLYLFSALLLLALPLLGEQLIVTDPDGQSTFYSFDQLDEKVGLIEREIPDDYLFKRQKSYVGYDLNRLFDVLGLSKDQQYLLVCTDGYEIEFDARHLEDARFSGFLARGDVEAGDDTWLPYKVGVNPTALSPFYLAWSSDEPEVQQFARANLPWPYALNEIRAHDPEVLHAAAKPMGEVDAVTRKGYELFTDLCMKCHKINEAGGSLGPELTTSPSVVFTTDEELADVIANITRYYPNSKMPTYAETLTEEETDAMVRYLRHINAEAMEE